MANISSSDINGNLYTCNVSNIVYVYIYVCMYVCMYRCMYVCMYICIWSVFFMCVCTGKGLPLDESVQILLSESTSEARNDNSQRLWTKEEVCMYVCM